LRARFYEPHHAALTRAVESARAAHGGCLVLDGHGFPTRPQPYEDDQEPDRAADRAIEIVRAARPGTIENAAQENFVRDVVLLATEEIAPDRVLPLSRFRGCLLGGALGDSLGEPVEFVGSAKEIAGRFGVRAPVMLGYAHTPLITDDTQMTLFAAEGIIRAGEARWDDDGAPLTRAVQAAFLRWLSTQEDGDAEQIAASPAGRLVTEIGLHHRRAPGNTCLSALQAQVGAKTLASVTSVLNTSKGCGAVMRAAPFGLAARTREQAFRWGRDTGAITQWSGRARVPSLGARRLARPFARPEAPIGDRQGT
jgi:ADP-ribosylglycohydrolase/N-formylglutamate amidohydrolase